jgi:DNA-binding PadR family transcriptional regulator
MFGRHLRGRHGPPWAEEEAETGRPHDHGWHDWRHRAFERRLHHMWPGRHEGHHRWPPFGGHDEAESWFSPRDRDHFGGFFGFRGPFSGGDPFDEDGHGRRRHRRGDIKYALLELLAEQPRHGYELIKELEQRYAGFYRPSPGSVYPTLQLLEDEGHLTSEQIDGKRVYTITESGRELLAEYHRQRAGEERHGRHGFRMGGAGPELHEFRESAMALLASVMQLARHGTREQVQAAVALLDSTRREIYALLAQAEKEDSAE